MEDDLIPILPVTWWEALDSAEFRVKVQSLKLALSSRRPPRRRPCGKNEEIGYLGDVNAETIACGLLEIPSGSSEKEDPRFYFPTAGDHGRLSDVGVGGKDRFKSSDFRR